MLRLYLKRSLKKAPQIYTQTIAKRAFASILYASFIHAKEL
ncbi:MAG: hypothetical protein SOZ73_01340 [Campylobacter sp.]|nr:hypothetical protein [Campylobacter sp.]